MLVENPRPKDILTGTIVASIGSRPVKVLEAGGGSKTKLDLARIAVETITTIDISIDQLSRNHYADHKIQGDLELYRYSDRYDLVVVNDVLEHLGRVDLALENLVEACADEGLIIIGGPNPSSLKGLLTRLTPHWVHVQFYKRILQYPNAGKPGRPPFETVFHPLADPGRLRGFLEKRRFRCMLLATYEGNTVRRMGATVPVARALLGVVTGAINLVTPKRYDARHSEFIAIFQKRAATNPS